MVEEEKRQKIFREASAKLGYAMDLLEEYRDLMYASPSEQRNELTDYILKMRVWAKMDEKNARYPYILKAGQVFSVYYVS